MVLAKVWRCVTADCPCIAYSPGPLCPKCGVLGQPIKPLPRP